MKKTVRILLAVLLSICMVFSIVALAACGAGEKGEKGDKGDPGAAGKSAYDIWLEAGHTGTEEDFLNWLRGDSTGSGSKGEQGDPGEDGATWIVKAGEPLPSDGKDGDLYLDTATWKVYNKVSGAWTLIGSIKGEEGEQGEQGEQGDPGAAGKNGNTWLVGEGAPDASEGADGDLYLDTTTWNVYHKESGAWVLLGCIKGADGVGGGAGEEQLEPITGSGQEADPYVINTAEGMQTLATKVNEGGESGIYVELGHDIDLAGIEWTPIGTATNKFTGSFDGKYHTISNMTITQGADYIGLFGITGDNAVIQNVKMVGANVDVDVEPSAGTSFATSRGAGIILGSSGSASKNPTIVTNVVVDETSKLDINKTNTSGYYAVGGVVGATVYAKVMLVQYSGSIVVNSNGTSNFKIGGITGVVQGSAAIGAADGVVFGAIFDGTLSVTTTAGTTQDIGGIAGYVSSTGYAYVDNCIFGGAITVDSTSKLLVGGIAGKANGDGANASYNISAGSIVASNCTVSNHVAFTDDDDADAKGNYYANDTTTTGKTVDNSNGTSTAKESSWFYVKENVHTVFSAVSLAVHISGNIVDYLVFSGSALPTLAWEA